jgi:hypothetical protein
LSSFSNSFFTTEYPTRHSRNQIILPTNDKKQRIDGGFGFSIRCFLLFAGETSSRKVCLKNKFSADRRTKLSPSIFSAYFHSLCSLLSHRASLLPSAVNST